MDLSKWHWMHCFSVAFAAICIPLLIQKLTKITTTHKKGSSMEYNHLFLKKTNHVFEEAVKFVRLSTKKLSHEQRLTLYALYKQATIGPCKIDQPSAADFIARAKWDSWKSLDEMDVSIAQAKYIRYIEEIFPEFGALGTFSTEKSSKAQLNDEFTALGANVSTMAYDTSGIEWQAQSDQYYFASIGKIEEIQKMIASDSIDLDAKDEEGRTMLHWAVDRSQIAVVELLVKHEADINIQDQDGMTCLHYAVNCENIELAMLLVNNGASVDVADQDGETPLSLAGSSDFIHVLCKKKPESV